MSRKQTKIIEEYSSEDDQYDDSYSPDEKDKIIAQQKEIISEMQKEFAATLDALRKQLREYVDESTQVQEDMLERIKELKAEVAKLKKKTTNPGRQTTVKSSIYQTTQKYPRKLAQSPKDVRKSVY
ncbi:hypothetical protein GPJ56_003652 [Histomonas meleagridis]|uniref:uncharacterized protein n=1 Tax=Histomonas meleagridis TaxID=135588 RepID=UPI003559563C|nr:hypothetical protein GPJ56_003652 [Histomonas meleagridis]KAH0800723.1 hypothetical protein GO595_006476 [Histomonas meleagridis]